MTYINFPENQIIERYIEADVLEGGLIVIQGQRLTEMSLLLQRYHRHHDGCFYHVCTERKNTEKALQQLLEGFYEKSIFALCALRGKTSARQVESLIHDHKINILFLDQFHHWNEGVLVEFLDIQRRLKERYQHSLLIVITTPIIKEFKERKPESVFSCARRIFTFPELDVNRILETWKLCGGVLLELKNEYEKGDLLSYNILQEVAAFVDNDYGLLDRLNGECLKICKGKDTLRKEDLTTAKLRVFKEIDFRTFKPISENPNVPNDYDRMMEALNIPK